MIKNIEKSVLHEISSPEKNGRANTKRITERTSNKENTEDPNGDRPEAGGSIIQETEGMLRAAEHLQGGHTQEVKEASEAA